jgi:cyclic-di-GMP-binding protein
MPSFDVVSQLDLQEVDNAVNNTKREVSTRYDFRNLKTEIDLDKKGKVIHLATASEMKMEDLKQMLVSHIIKRGVSPKALDFGEAKPAGMDQVKLDVKLREGIEKDLAKKLVKKIKDLGLKVQPAIQDEQIRVTAKKIDDLQAVIQMLKAADVEIPLQYVNMKS